MVGKIINCVNKKEGILSCNPTLAGFNLVFLLHFWWILGDFQTFLGLCPSELLGRKELTLFWEQPRPLS